MRFRLRSLVLALSRDTVIIDLADVSYFWGQMGAGKTSIARLIDYCLGGDIELTPALQSEFVSATLNMSLERADLSVERPREADRVIAAWGEGDDFHQVNLPARRAEGEVVPDTGVENLSDLLFWLSGLRAPRVRKSRVKSDSDTARLSMRDLLWYCYLDQDEIDSSFFYLDDHAPWYLRNKSRDVVRYVIGFHDERVAEIEAELDELRGEHQALSTSISGLVRVLKEVDFDSEAQIQGRIEALNERIGTVQTEIDTARGAAETERRVTHAADDLRQEARSLGEDIAKIDEAIANLGPVLDADRRHLHEIETLSLKFRRSISAKAVLVGVSFEACPRCARALPERDAACCSLCGQPDQTGGIDPTELALIERDAKQRIAELTDLVAKHEEAGATLRKSREKLVARKERVERERNEALSRYDSAYLSTMLAKERERAALAQEAESIAALMRLPRMVEEQHLRLSRVVERERSLREEHKVAREAAESDATNLAKLKDYFLDCLVQSGVPGITADDRVEIPTSSFYPEMYGPETEDTTVTTFATLSSGGKKTLFKCCFAIALHRLAVDLKAPLPELLIIDSPMKNISERENRQQFEGFYRLLYELKTSELRNTQMVLIDKEYSAPAETLGLGVVARHMRPGDAHNPPLIPYYEGK